MQAVPDTNVNKKKSIKEASNKFFFNEVTNSNFLEKLIFNLTT
jgi:hypothetical protein